MAALVEIELRLDRRPARIPDRAVVGDIEVPAAHVDRHIVVAVTGDAAQTGILIEAVAAGGVGDQGKESLRSEVIDPRIRRPRRLDDVFLARAESLITVFTFSMISFSLIKI